MQIISFFILYKFKNTASAQLLYKIQAGILSFRGLPFDFDVHSIWVT